MAQEFIMIPKTDPCIEIKKELGKYVGLLETQKKLPKINYIINIAKQILFLKIIVSCKGNTYYSNFMIYDLLNLIHFLTQKSKRNIYCQYRSFIENFFRFTLNFNDNDRTGVVKIIELFKEKYSQTQEQIDVNSYIIGEYSRCCDFVHSNIRAEMSILEYYKDILENDEMNNKEISKIIVKVSVCMRKITLFIIYNYPQIIDKAFYRKKQQLKYLIGENAFQVWKNCIE